MQRTSESITDDQSLMLKGYIGIFQKHDFLSQFILSTDELLLPFVRDNEQVGSLIQDGHGMENVFKLHIVDKVLR